MRIDLIRSKIFFSSDKLMEESVSIFTDLVSTQVLLEAGCNPVDSFLNSFDTMTEDTLSFLLKEKKIDPSSHGHHSLLLAVKKRDKPWILRLLLEDGRADPSVLFDGESLLSLACIHGNSEGVKIILADKRIDPTALALDAFRAATQCPMIWRENVMRELFSDERVGRGIPW